MMLSKIITVEIFSSHCEKSMSLETAVFNFDRYISILIQSNDWTTQSWLLKSWKRNKRDCRLLENYICFFFCNISPFSFDGHNNMNQLSLVGFLFFSDIRSSLKGRSFSFSTVSLSCFTLSWTLFASLLHVSELEDNSTCIIEDYQDLLNEIKKFPSQISFCVPLISSNNQYGSLWTLHRRIDVAYRLLRALSVALSWFCIRLHSIQRIKFDIRWIWASSTGALGRRTSRFVVLSNISFHI